MADDTITQCQVQLIKGSKYRIQYTPTVRGCHELIVTVNGQEVSGSHFPVFVSIHPTLLGKPVGVMTGVKKPWDVAITVTGNIIVTDNNSNTCTLFDKNGKKLRNLSILKSSDITPHGIAVDNADGCIYISNWGKKIVKLNPDFELVGELTGQEECQYRYLAVVGDEVMVTERSKNVVMVYTKDLKYVRQFGSHGDGPGRFMDVLGVSSSETGNLYVTDCARKSVHVFSNGGESIGSVSIIDGVKLHRSFGVRVVGQYVYVANNSDRGVCVFTTEGEYVTSFGEHDLRNPTGICLDKDGYVYVCDYTGNRVVIF